MTTERIDPHSAVPTGSLIRRPWHFGSPKWYRRVAVGLYLHHCEDPDIESHVGHRLTMCFEETEVPGSRKGPKPPRIPEHLVYPAHKHVGPYEFPLTFVSLFRRLLFFMLVALRRSLGRTKYPAVWLVMRQLLVVVPLVAIAGAAGQSLLTVQVLVISILVRVPYQTFRFRLWILAYHNRGCPDPRAFRPYRLVDWSGAAAAIVEVLPIQVIGICLWLFVSPSPTVTLEFITAVVLATTTTFFVSLTLSPVIADHYFNNRPDVRHVLATLSALLLAFGILLYSPTSILHVPAWLETALEYVPWTSFLFLPLKIGVVPLDLRGLGVSAILTVVVCAILWRLGKNARRHSEAWEPDFDEDDEL